MSGATQASIRQNLIYHSIEYSSVVYFSVSG
jgi:hypothetical protein